MHDDVLAIVTGSSLPLMLDEIVLDAMVWLIPRGGKRREVEAVKVVGILELLRSEGLVAFYEGRGWHRPIVKAAVDPQKLLFS
jgi:hypothetical protein